MPKLKCVKEDNLFEKATTVEPEFYTTATLYNSIINGNTTNTEDQLNG